MRPQQPRQGTHPPLLMADPRGIAAFTHRAFRQGEVPSGRLTATLCGQRRNRQAQKKALTSGSVKMTLVCVGATSTQSATGHGDRMGPCLRTPKTPLLRRASERRILHGKEGWCLNLDDGQPPQRCIRRLTIIPPKTIAAFLQGGTGHRPTRDSLRGIDPTTPIWFDHRREITAGGHHSVWRSTLQD